ncbi:MAG: hypothetical protein ICCCNLDF_03569 [Planctomycetes bacterium]|nr:hypothetical protein [Planctomycetota bacterium]
MRLTMSRTILTCIAFSLLALVAACTTTAHSKTFIPEVKPAESPLTSSGNLDWPTEGRWVEFVLDRDGVAVGDATFWSIRFYVLPDGSIKQAVEKRDLRESSLVVELVDGDGEATYRLSGSNLSEWGFTFAEATLSDEERVLVLTYEPEWGPTWIIHCD